MAPCHTLCSKAQALRPHYRSTDLGPVMAQTLTVVSEKRQQKKKKGKQKDFLENQEFPLHTFIQIQIIILTFQNNICSIFFLAGAGIKSDGFTHSILPPSPPYLLPY